MKNNKERMRKRKKTLMDTEKKVKERKIMKWK